MTLVEKLAQARASGDYQALFEAVPYSKFLGLSAKLEGSELITTMTYADHLIGNPALPALHGGTLGALLESTAVFALLVDGELAALPRIINLTVEYLRSAKAVDTFARAEITRQGRRVATVRAFAWQDDPSRPVAAANAHFLLTGGAGND